MDDTRMQALQADIYSCFISGTSMHGLAEKHSATPEEFDNAYQEVFEKCYLFLPEKHQKGGFYYDVETKN